MNLCALPTVNNLDCEHGQSFAQCNRCKGKSANKMGTLWLLDSGASLHFTHDFNDFIEYETAKSADRMPVRKCQILYTLKGKVQCFLSTRSITSWFRPTYTLCIISQKS
jgi:hypothetical protein